MVTTRTIKRRTDRVILRKYARDMRHEPTGAEKVLWSMLRDRRLGGYKFKRQFPVGSYIADFVCIEEKLIVELDGAQHDERKSYDAKRDSCLTNKGFRVVRFWNEDFLADVVGTSRYVLHLLSSGPPPSPKPSPPAGERVS